MTIASGLYVHPVVSEEFGQGVDGWKCFVEISVDAESLPFLRLELSQPLYSVPPPLRVVPLRERFAAVGQAFASLLHARMERTTLARPSLTRCMVDPSKKGGAPEAAASSRSCLTNK